MFFSNRRGFVSLALVSLIAASSAVVSSADAAAVCTKGSTAKRLDCLSREVGELSKKIAEQANKPSVLPSNVQIQTLVGDMPQRRL
jgi:hypothetical protein